MEKGSQRKYINLYVTFDNGPNINLAAKFLMGQNKSEFTIPSSYWIPSHIKCTGHTLQKIVSFGIEKSSFNIDDDKFYTLRSKF